MNILLTGAAGFIGAKTGQFLLDADHSVTWLWRPAAGRMRCERVD